MITDFNKLLSLSQWLGDNWLFSQASGGNTSVKSSSGIWIKASGAWLSHSETDPSTFIFIDSNNIVGAIRPSMELPFHLAIPYKFVCHYHSIYFLLCSICGLSKEYLQSQNVLHNREVQLLSYKEPGQSLFTSINSLVLDLTEAEAPKVIFLENHGIIVSSETDSECIKIIESFNKSLIRFLEKYFANLPLLQSVFIEGTQSTQLQMLKDPILLTPSQLVSLKKALSTIPSNSVFFPDQMVALGYTDTLFSDSYIDDAIKLSRTVGLYDCASHEVFSKIKSNSSAQSYYLVVSMLLLMLSSGPSNIQLNVIQGSDCASLLLNPDEKYRKEKMDGLI